MWTRDAPQGENRPAGMGVKLIDVEDSVVAAIERMVELRERTERGLGEPPKPVGPRPHDAPAGPPAQTVPTAPIVTAAPGRERTLLGVGLSAPAFSPPAPAPPRAPPPSSPPAPPPPPAAAQGARPREASVTREPSVVIDLVTERVDTPRTADADWGPESEPPPSKRRGPGRWIAVIALLAIAGATTYAILDGDFDALLRPFQKLATPPQPPPAPAPTVAAPTAVRPVATPAATATTSAATTASGTTAASSSAAPTPPASAAPAASGTGPASPVPSKGTAGAAGLLAAPPLPMYAGPKPPPTASSPTQPPRPPGAVGAPTPAAPRKPGTEDNNPY